MGTYAYSGNKNKQRDNHADEYLPDLLNDIQDEIEIVEQVLSGGEEGQVLTADSAGKAKWAVGGGGGSALYDDVEITTIPNESGSNTTTVTFLLNGDQITSPVWLIWVLSSDEDDNHPIFGFGEEGVVMIESGESGGDDYELLIFLSTGEVKIISLTNQEQSTPPPG